ATTAAGVPCRRWSRTARAGLALRPGAKSWEAGRSRSREQREPWLATRGGGEPISARRLGSSALRRLVRGGGEGIREKLVFGQPASLDEIAPRGIDDDWNPAGVHLVAGKVG